MSEEWNIEGKNFLITGGASGLGAGYSEEFLKNGAKNIAILDIDEEKGTEFVKKLNETYNDKAIFIKCDVSKEEDIKDSFDKVVDAFERIDVIINNAGVMNDAPNVWRVASEINWLGVASFTMKGVNHMRTDQGKSGGTIINISSGAGIVKFSIVPIYCGSKAAVLQFGRSLAIPPFYATTGVRVLTLVLGATKTALIDDITSKTYDEDITTPWLQNMQLFEQNIDSAVATMTKMFREGNPGSVWLSIYDKPGEDITDTINAAYAQIEKLLLPGGRKQKNTIDLQLSFFKRRSDKNVVLDVKIEGKNVLITGGASGLGAAYADAFLKSGAKNVAILDIAEKVGADYAEKLNETYNNKVTFIKCDVSKEEEIKNCFQEALNRIKRIDVIINNAGIMDDSIYAWRKASDVNWQGLVSFTRKGIRHMRKDEGGSGGTIINVSSTAALVQTMDILPVYSGCKAAVLCFSRSLSSPQFYDETGVRILTICLGPTATPLLSNIEQKCFDQKVTKQFLVYANYQYQRVDSAVQAMLKMFREGNPGSVWLSNQNEPGLDITSVLDEAYTPLIKLLLPSSSTTTVSK